MQSLKTICIIVPIYKNELNKNEEKSIYNTIKQLEELDMYFIAPTNINRKYYKKFKGFKYKTFDEKYFKDVNGYNKLLINSNFYYKFIDYDYMLIVQPDAWILKDYNVIKKIAAKNYDYWGAVWYTELYARPFEFKDKFNIIYKNMGIKCTGIGKKNRIYVGNGGLSLRNVNKTIELLKEKRVYATLWGGNEDMFFAYHGMKNKCGYHIAPINEAKYFSTEQKTKQAIENDEIPFGIHAWEKWYPKLINNLSIEVK